MAVGRLPWWSSRPDVKIATLRQTSSLDVRLSPMGLCHFYHKGNLLVVATSSKSLYISAHASNLHAAVNNEVEFLNPEEGSNAET